MKQTAHEAIEQILVNQLQATIEAFQGGALTSDAIASQRDNIVKAFNIAITRLGDKEYRENWGDPADATFPKFNSDDLDPDTLRRVV